jgi:threonine dehydratase
MAEISHIIASHDINIRNVRYKRLVKELSVGGAFLHFRIETNRGDQTSRVIKSLREEGHTVGRVEDV